LRESRAERSFRRRLRAFQAMHGDPPDPAFAADLAWLQNRDLDLSVRLSALLAFNALAATVGTYPVSVSPGAPLSLDAATQPLLTIANLLGIAPIGWSSVLCLRALLIGEEVDRETRDAADQTLRQRLFAAFIRSLDVQERALRAGVRWTLAGGAATALVWAAILAGKIMR
jgi:hypothetical protein